MDFQPTDDQRMLADTLRRFIAERYPLEARTDVFNTAPGYAPEVWAQFAEIGALGALFAPEVGGYGGTPADVATVFESLGAGAVAGPFLACLVSGHILACAGNEANLGLLAAIIEGASIVSLAHQEPTGRYDLRHVATTATPTGDGWRIDGNKAVVSYADAADYLIVSARTSGGSDDPEGVSLFLLRADTPGVSIRGYRSADGARMGEVRLREAQVASDQLLGTEGGGLAFLDAANDLGLLALCAEGMGGLDVAKDLTTEYLKTRVQFGQPIGSFQVLQHRMATLLIEIEQARSALINAIAAFETPEPGRARALSAGKFTLGRVAALVAEEAVQMHGGIGMTWELPLTHYVRRLIMLDHQLGDVDHHLERFVALTAAR